MTSGRSSGATIRAVEALPVDHHATHAVHLRREALTMALYVSITLLAALTATYGETMPRRDVLAIVWGTTVGLALAHWLAFGLAVRLVHPAGDNADLQEQLKAQLGAAATVALVATVPVLVLPVAHVRTGARLATAGMMAFATYGEARTFGASRAKALRMAAVALVLGLTVAAVKYALGH